MSYGHPAMARQCLDQGASAAHAYSLVSPGHERIGGTEPIDGARVPLQVLEARPSIRIPVGGETRPVGVLVNAGSWNDHRAGPIRLNTESGFDKWNSVRQAAC